jgi:hypothetical protein
MKNLTNYNLQSDYVDKLTDAEKLKLFCSLGDEIQSIADIEWNSDENYSEQFMIDWITNSYAEHVTTPFYHCDMFCPSDEDEDEQKWFDMFTDYEPYDINHVVCFYMKDGVNVQQIMDDGDTQDIYQVDAEENVIEFLCPMFWLDVPKDFLISFIMENVCDFTYDDIQSVSVQG